MSVHGRAHPRGLPQPLPLPLRSGLHRTVFLVRKLQAPPWKQTASSETPRPFPSTGLEGEKRAQGPPPR